MKRLIALTAVLLACWATPALNAAEHLSDSEKEEFLLNAKVRTRKSLSVGITNSERATLDDGRMRHDAHLQDIDEYKPVFQGAQGTQLNFRDNYIFNVAAYRLDRLINLNMVPVSVERKVAGRTSSVTWWIDDVLMMEKERYQKKIAPRDALGWNDQMYNVRVFNELVANTDPNLGNVLITEDWKIRLIDFTRAFRADKQVRKPENLPHRVDRRVFEGLKALDAESLQSRLGDTLRSSEIKGLLARRDEIVEYFDRLIAQKGEARGDLQPGGALGHGLDVAHAAMRSPGRFCAWRPTESAMV